jgi:lipid II:glycine glycyltransferase (peptidoglycan interpeptide bridge formation enzyme)
MTSYKHREPGITVIRNAATWDELVCRHTSGGFMQSSRWGDFKRHFGWTPFRICLPAVTESPPPLAQVMFRRIPYSPYTVGYLPRGPLLDYESDEELDRMIRAVDRLARHARAVSVTWELPVARDPVLTARLERLGLKPASSVQHTSTRVIDLSATLEEIQASWKPKWRSNTRLAVKHGVRVRPAGDVADFARWYELFKSTSVRDNFTVRGEEYYQRFWQQQYEVGDTVLLLAEHDNRLLAGILVHHFGREATYLYGASSNESRNLMPNHLLQWEAMQWGKLRGATQYDMFGIADSDDENEALAGVSRFKAGFGGEAVRYAGAFERVYHPLIHAAVQRARAGGLG